MVSQAAERLDSARKSSGDDIYIFQLFDNSFHMARSECIYLPHSQDSSGRYHVYG